MPLLGTRAPGLEGIEWVNSGLESLDAGTYLVNFWQSSCLRCMDMVESLERIHSSHPELEAIGIHVPEFGLGKEAVEKFVGTSGVEHHVGHDEEQELAERFGVTDSTRTFLVHDGEIVWQKTPGNSYRELEQRVEELTGEGAELGEDSDASPDSYLGYSYGGVVNDGVNFRGSRDLSPPGNRMFERVYLDGGWLREEDFLESRGGALSIHQRSSRAGAVMGADGVKDVEVRMDGEPVPPRFAGDDLRIENGRSYARVSQDRMYSLVSGQGKRYELELRPEENTRLYKLSFL